MLEMIEKWNIPSHGKFQYLDICFHVESERKAETLRLPVECKHLKKSKSYVETF